MTPTTNIRFRRLSDASEEALAALGGDPRDDETKNAELTRQLFRRYGFYFGSRERKMSADELLATLRELRHVEDSWQSDALLLKWLRAMTLSLTARVSTQRYLQRHYPDSFTDERIAEHLQQRRIFRNATRLLERELDEKRKEFQRASRTLKRLLS